MGIDKYLGRRARACICRNLGACWVRLGSNNWPHKCSFGPFSLWAQGIVTHTHLDNGRNVLELYRIMLHKISLSYLYTYQKDIQEYNPQLQESIHCQHHKGIYQVQELYLHHKISIDFLVVLDKLSITNDTSKLRWLFFKLPIVFQLAHLLFVNLSLGLDVRN